MQTSTLILSTVDKCRDVPFLSCIQLHLPPPSPSSGAPSPHPHHSSSSSILVLFLLLCLKPRTHFSIQKKIKTIWDSLLKMCLFCLINIAFCPILLRFWFLLFFPRSSERAYFVSFNCLKTNVVLPIISSAPPLLETLHPRLLRYRAFSCDMDRPPHFHNAHCN